METHQGQTMEVIFNEGKKKKALKFADDKRHNEISAKKQLIWKCHNNRLEETKFQRSG